MIVLSHALIELGMTKDSRGVAKGFSKAHAQVLDVPWPLTSGWKDGLIGKEISPEQFQAYLDLGLARQQKKEATLWMQIAEAESGGIAEPKAQGAEGGPPLPGGLEGEAIASTGSLSAKPRADG